MQRPEQVGGHNHSATLPATAPGEVARGAPGGAFAPSPVRAPAGRWRLGWGGEVLNLPNLITFARLCAVPVVLWLVLAGRMGWALALFALAGVSDALDGWLARRRGGTVLGAWMDPAADKALLVGMFVVLAWAALVPAWMAALVVVRDMVILGGIAAMWRLRRPIRIRPLLIGKINTALQILLVGVVVLLESLGLQAPGLRDVLVWTTAAATALSGGLYVWTAARAGRPDTARDDGP